MKLLMICKGEYYNFMPQIADRLKQKYGYYTSAVTFSTPTGELRQLQPFEHVFNLAAHLKQYVSRHDLKTSMEYLDDLERSGQVECFNVMLYADRIIRRYRFDDALQILAGVCTFWQKVLQELQPNAIVGEVACASEWLGWSFAQRRGIQYLIPYPGPLPRRFYFLRSPTGGWDAAEALYETIKQEQLSPDQIRVAKDFLSTFRSQHLRSDIHAPAFRSPIALDRLTLKKLIQRAERVPFRTRTYLVDGCYEVGSYNGTPPWEGILSDLVRALRHLVCQATRLFDTQVVPGKKVYFPLHVQPEFTIDVRAPFCSNQLAVIEKIAKSLPTQYRLIVKDHPGMRGWRPLDYYREIKKLYNVQLVSPSLDSHAIIKESDAIVTIVGTTAWEGILYEKPVIALGPLAYKFFDLLYNCNNLADLPGLLSRAIFRYQTNYDQVLKFIWAVLETAHRAEWHDPLATPHVLEKANIDAIAQAIVSDVFAAGRSELASVVPV